MPANRTSMLSVLLVASLSAACLAEPPPNRGPGPESFISIDGDLRGEVSGVLDLNGNGIPDILEFDRNNNGIPDYEEGGALAFITIDNRSDTFARGVDGFRDAGLAFTPDSFVDSDACDNACLEQFRARSSVNTGRLVVIYLPDSDNDLTPTDPNDPFSGDDSLLYIGFDIFNGVQQVVGNPGAPGAVEGRTFQRLDYLLAPGTINICENGILDFNGNGIPDNLGVPFDIDADGSPITFTRFDDFPGCQLIEIPAEDALEEYRIFLYACTPLIGPVGASPGSETFGNGTGRTGVPAWLTEETPDMVRQETRDPSGCVGTLGDCLGWIRLKANDTGGDPNLVEFECQLDVDNDGNCDVPPALLPQVFQTFPMNGQSLASLTNIPPDPNRPGDVEFVVRGFDSLLDRLSPAPIEQDRLRFAFGTIETLSDNQGDSSAEDTVRLRLRSPIPGLRVEKLVRCVTPGPSTCQPNLEIVGGTQTEPQVYEYCITIENTGNVPLQVSVQDLLDDLTSVGATPITNMPLTATFFSAANPGGVAIDPLSPPGELIGEFFFPGDAKPESFLAGVVDRQFKLLGTLQPGDICANTIGDRVEFTFRVQFDDQVCGADVDIRNTLNVEGVPLNNGNFPQEVIDILAVRMANATADVNVLCRDTDFNKFVGFPGNEGSFVTGDMALTIPDNATFPLDLEYRYIVENSGEVPENVMLVDTQFCADVSAAPGVAFVPGSCALCAGGGMINDPVSLDPGTSRTYSCVVRFDSLQQLRDFLTRDDGRSCAGSNPEIDNDPECYRNCARVTFTPQLTVSLRGPAGDPSRRNISGYRAFDQVPSIYTSVPAPEEPEDRDTVIRQPICGEANPTDITGYSIICNRQCRLGVDKTVRCLPDCIVPPGIDPNNPEFVDVLPVAPNACVQYQIVIENNPDGIDNAPAICRLEITDTLDPNCVTVDPNSVQFQIGGVNCPVPAGFNVTGIPFTWDPTTCRPGQLFEPGEKLIIRFTARVNNNATAAACNPIDNDVRVRCATFCNPPIFCCDVTDNAQINVQTPSLNCVRKQWSFMSDTDANCVPNGPFSSPAVANLDLSNRVFPVLLRLEIEAQNNGQIPLDVTVNDAPLTTCAATTAGVDLVQVIVDDGNGIANTTAAAGDIQVVPVGQPVAPGEIVVLPGPDGVLTTLPAAGDREGGCELGETRLLPVGASDVWLCYVYVESAAAARQLAICDGANDLFYNNQAMTTATLVSDGVICVGPDTVINGNNTNCAASIRVPEQCVFALDKGVRCAEDTAANYLTSVISLPGGAAEFRVQVCNTGPVPIARICLTDTLTCDSWYNAASLTADVVRTDGVTRDSVLGNFTGVFAPDGVERCYLLTSRGNGQPPWLQPGECLEIKFQVNVPANFNVIGVSPDCTNTAVVQTFAEACGPGQISVFSPCGPPQTDNATIDVRIPSITCDKAVSLDGVNFTDDLQIPNDVVFPLTLTYRFQATNSGETTLNNVVISDPDLLNAALVAGATVNPACALCTGACNSGGNDGSINVGSLAAGASSPEFFCAITFADDIQFADFAGLDNGRGRLPERCHVNIASVSGDVNLAQICDGQPTQVTSTCQVEVCFIQCRIMVDKKVRCLPTCVRPAGAVDPNDPNFVDGPLPVAPESCVEYQIVVRNDNPVGVPPICALRFTDLLDTTCIDVDPNSLRIAFNGGACNSVPGGLLKVDGTSFVWLPQYCNRPAFNAGDVLTLRFTARVKADATAACNPINNLVTVECATECPPGGPVFCCEVMDDVDIEVRTPSLRCVDKRWSFMSDTDGDCQPNGPFSAASSAIDLSNVVFPVLLKLEIEANNNGQIPLDVTVNDTQLVNCVNSTAGICFAQVILDGGNNSAESTRVGNDVQIPLAGAGQVSILPGPNCSIESTLGGDDVLGVNEIGETRTLAPGASSTWTAYVYIETAKAARTLANCDGQANLIYRNQASLSGKLVSDGNICVPPNKTITGNNVDCEATVNMPPPCDITVTKGVRLAANPADPFEDAIEAVRGDRLTFRVTVTNSGPVPVARVCITDTLSCIGWLDAASIQAEVGGDDVSADFATFNPNGTRQCFTFGSRNAVGGPPWIAPGEALLLEFDVVVPESYNVCSQVVDCSNSVTVEGFTEACPPVLPGSTQEPCVDQAGPVVINVLVPCMRCTKAVSSPQVPGGPTSLLDISDPVFPLTLNYTFSVENFGELEITDVCLTDLNLVPDIIAAGGTVGACALDRNADCSGPGQQSAFIGTLAPGAIETVTCSVTLTQSAFEALIGGIEGCYTNTASATGIPAAGLPPIITTNPCTAQVCGSATPEDCPPVYCAKYLWYNENESARSVSYCRCINSWEQKLVSRYVESPNFFFKALLGTNAGFAKIDAPFIGGNPCNQPIEDVPLIGVKAHRLEFKDSNGNTTKVKYAGDTLLGYGTQAGRIDVRGVVLSTLQPNPENAATTDSTSPKDLSDAPLPALALNQSAKLAPIGTKGSLIVYPKVEIRWTDNDGNGLYSPAAGDELVQDTFIALSNDSDLGGVNVIIFAVNGNARKCNSQPHTALLTREHPVRWSALTGQPGIGQAQGRTPIVPFLTLDPEGIPAQDPRDPAGRLAHGYYLVWATNAAGQEVHWNNLSGNATLVNYRESYAWEYNAWPFVAIAGEGDNANTPLPTPGVLNLDGNEYSPAPDKLLVEFFAVDPDSSAFIRPGNNSLPVAVDLDLTLWAVQKELP